MELIKGWHGETEGPIRGLWKKPELYIGLDKSLAHAYAAPHSANRRPRVHRVTYESENPLHIRDGRQIKDLIDETGGYTQENWYPEHTHRIAEAARRKGHDSVIIHPEAFTKDEESWEHASGTFGEPQAVILNPHKAVFWKRSVPSDQGIE